MNPGHLRDGVEQTARNLVTAFNGEAHSSALYVTFVHVLRDQPCRALQSLFSACAFSEQVHAARHAKVALFLGREIAVTIVPIREAATPQTPDVMFQRMLANIATPFECYPKFIAIAEQEHQHLGVLSFDGALKSKYSHLELAKQFMADPSSWNSHRIPFYVCSLCGMTRASNDSECPVCGARSTKFVDF